MKEDIAEMQEITISYVNPDWPGELRRQTLKRDYGFDCSCDKCKEEIELEQADLETLAKKKAPKTTPRIVNNSGVEIEGEVRARG